jgi:hypothetical protein
MLEEKIRGPIMQQIAILSIFLRGSVAFPRRNHPASVIAIGHQLLINVGRFRDPSLTRQLDDPVGPEANRRTDQLMQHVERHFSGGETVRDVVIGMADGLTVPFALAAGISGAITSTHIVVTAGLPEVAAGSIAMGLGGFLAAKGGAEHYESELKRALVIPKSNGNPFRRVWRALPCKA